MNHELERLEIRLGFIQQRMSTLRSEGKIAPPKTWIQKYVVPKKNGLKYYYYRLMEACEKRSSAGSIQGKLKLYLGSKSSPKYRSYREAIARRNELQVLQRRYNKLMALYRKALEKAVSLGSEKRSIVLEQPPYESVDLNSRVLVRVLEEIQQTQNQLWHWLKLIGERVGITITQPCPATG
ncbi:MAG: hypothetical protein QNJ54_25170 [Prochloraceae cyanobacterium]|nr:hypothetical protein [Prochloraceae cyanobacterium]